MKAGIFYIFLFLLVSNINTYSQSEETKDKIDEVLYNIVSLAKEKDYEKISNNFVYKGSDKTRYGKDNYNIYNLDERQEVINISNKIKKYFDDADESVFGDLYTKSVDGVLWYIKEVLFRYEKKKDSQLYFIFMKLRSKFLLFEIE